MKISFVLTILFLSLFINGCLYVKRDIGLTTYQYDKCEEYYDENGTYHKECKDSDIKILLENFLKRFKKSDKKEVRSDISKSSSESLDRGEIVYKKKKCICSKRCIKSCEVKDIYCLKKCCHEKK